MDELTKEELEDAIKLRNRLYWCLYCHIWEGKFVKMDLFVGKSIHKCKRLIKEIVDNCFYFDVGQDFLNDNLWEIHTMGDVERVVKRMNKLWIAEESE